MIQGFVAEVLEPIITEAVKNAVQSSIQPKDEFYTVAEAMERLHVSQASIYRYRAQGRFAFHKIGGKTLIKKSDLEKAVERSRGWRVRGR